MKATTKSNKILRAQRVLIVGYLIALTALCVAIALMPTKLLVFGGVYGHSILFWVSLIGVTVCYLCFRKKNSHFKKTTVKLPTKAFRLCRGKECKWFLLATLVAFVLFVILLSAVGTAAGFVAFAAFALLLGLYLGANSREYRIYRKHKASL